MRSSNNMSQGTGKYILLISSALVLISYGCGAPLERYLSTGEEAETEKEDETDPASGDATPEPQIEETFSESFGSFGEQEAFPSDENGAELPETGDVAASGETEPQEGPADGAENAENPEDAEDPEQPADGNEEAGEDEEAGEEDPEEAEGDAEDDEDDPENTEKKMHDGCKDWGLPFLDFFKQSLSFFHAKPKPCTEAEEASIHFGPSSNPLRPT